MQFYSDTQKLFTNLIFYINYVIINLIVMHFDLSLTNCLIIGICVGSNTHTMSMFLSYMYVNWQMKLAY